MKTNFLRNLSLMTMITLIAFACNKGPYPGYKQTQDGLYYKILKANSEKPLPQIGDVLTLNLYYCLAHNDSIIFDSRVYNEPVVLPVQKPFYKGDINEGLFMIAEGDSASFIVKADSFLLYNVNLEKMPDFVKPETMFRFEIKVLSHKTQAEYMEEERVRREMFEAENNRLEKKEKEDLDEYVKSQNIKVKPTESGMYFIPIKSGNGTKVERGDYVFAHYKGYFLDGQLFDSSEGAPEPFRFSAGFGQVISGWDEAVMKMRQGDKAKIILPSSLAYGKSAPNHPIPPFSSLIFEIEIVEVQKRDKK